MPLPQSNQGILLVIGAGFFLIGMLGGGFEISAIKIPSIGKWPRVLLSTLGSLFMISGLVLLFNPTGNAAGVAVVPTATPAPPPTVTPTPILAVATDTPLPPTPVPGVSTPTSAPVVASAVIQDVTLEHNVTQFEKSGMRIHVKFTVDGLKGVQCRAVAYFYNADGTIVKSNTAGYHTTGTESQASTGQNFTPIYDSARFDDLALFMPYSVFDYLSPGKYPMKVQVELWDLRNLNQSLAQSDFVTFDFTRGE